MEDRLTVLYEKKPSYDIVFAKDFSRLNEEVSKLFETNRKLCIVTDSNVGPHYADTVCAALSESFSKVMVHTFPAGEDHKTLDTVKALYVDLIENHFDRKDVLIALGGGVVGDLTGYTAATYLRGISFIQIPTTLLSQCDSSIGGKTGVDFDGYKNMVGAFHMPKLVYMNVETLNTLSPRQYFSGFAEVMKHGLIKNASFYEWLIENMYEICDRDLDVLMEMIYESCMVKKQVVEKDPKEQGERALLNFGHTLGHAIEKYKNFELFHGECVALGAVCAAFISWKHELLSMEEYYEIRDMFVPFYLPITVDGIDIEQVIALTKSDKKMDGNHVKFVLLKKVGKAVVDLTVTDDDMRAALKELIIDEME